MTSHKGYFETGLVTRRTIAHCLFGLSLILSGIGPVAGVASTARAAAEANPDCPDCLVDIQPENRPATPEERAADVGAVNATSYGQLLDVLIAPPRLAISGYDHAQLTALDGLFKQLTLQADEEAIERYQATGELPPAIRDAVLTNLNLRTLPTIDIRVIKTLNALTTPVALGGAGQEWIRVPTIKRGYVSQTGALAHNESTTDDRHIAPFHYGEGFAASELDYLRSTRFLYEVEAEAGHEDEPVNWSRAKLVEKQKLPKQPIQVAWQATDGASQGDALPELLTESFNGLATTLGTNRFTTDLRDRLSEQGVELPEQLSLDSATVGALTTSLGTARLVDEFAAGEPIVTNSSLWENFYRSGQAVIATNMKGVIPPWGIVGGQNTIVAAGWAVIADTLHLTGSIDGPTSAIVLEKIAKRHLEHELQLAPTSLDRISDDDQGSVTRAIGLGWLEARLNRDLSGLWNQSLEEFATSDPTSYLALYAEPAVTQAILELTLTDELDNLTPAELLTRVGQTRLNSLAEQYQSIDAALGIAVKAGRESGRSWFDRFLAADAADRRQIGAWVAATTLSPELSTQDNLFNWFISGVEPIGSANRPLVDTSYIEMKFELIPGDLKRIFVDNRGWEVARRSGHIGYAEGLLGQATSIATTDLKPILTGERFTEGYERVKAEAESVIRNAESNLATVPNTILGTLVSALQAEVNSTNQQVTDRINSRLAQQGDMNQFEQFFGGLRGQVSRLASYTQYGPPEVRTTLGDPINSLSIELDNLQIGSAGHQLQPPEAWRDVLNRSGSPIPHVDGDALWQDIKGGLEGTFSFDNLLMVSGARAYGDQLFQHGEELATNLGRYVRGLGKNFETFDPRPGAAKVTTGTVEHEALHEEGVSPSGFPSGGPTGTDPSGSATTSPPSGVPADTGPAGASANGPKLTIDRQGIRNFIQSDLLPSVNFADWTTEVLVTFDLATKPGYRLTTDETIDFVAGASSKVTQTVGAQTIDIAYALNVGRPFIKVLTDELSFDQAFTGAALDHGLGYAYHLTNQLTLENGLANAVKDIVAEEALGLAHDSLQSRQALLDQNGPDTILRLAGALPNREANQSLLDYERAKASAYQDLLTDPERYRAGLNQSITAAGGSPAATDDLVRILGNSQPLAAESTSELDDFVGELSANRIQDLITEMGSPTGSDDEKARFATWQNGLYTSLMPTVDPTSLSDAERAELDDQSRAFYAAAKTHNVTALETAATDLKRTALGHQLGTAPDLLKPRVSRLTDRLSDLGIRTLDQLVDPDGIVPGGPFRTFYKSQNVAESAATAAWGVIQRFVDFPPELTEALGYLGGDPLTIAKTWSDGRLNTALGLMATSQLLNATEDVGISVAVGDALIAYLGPSASDMELIQQRARAQADAAATAIADQARSNLTSQPTGTIEGLDAALTDGTVEQVAAFERERVYKEHVTAQLENPQFQKVLRDRRDTAMKNVRYATLDYGATLAVRAASGSTSVTMAGFSRTMLEGSNRAKVLYLAQTLAALNEAELGEYLQDGLAAYDIYSFFQQPAFEIVVETTTTDPAGPGQPTSVIRENKRVVPEAAFTRIDSRLSQLLGWSVPPGFTKAFFSFVQGNFDLTVRGGNGTLPSMNDVITSPTVQFYIGNWLDTTVGLPQGTSFTAWQIHQEIQLAQQTVAQAQNSYNLALAGLSLTGTTAGAVAGAAGSSSTLAAAQVLGVDPSATNTIEALTTYDPNAARIANDGIAATAGSNAGNSAATQLGYELGSNTASSPALTSFQMDGASLGSGLTPSTESLIAANGGELGQLSNASQAANLQYAQITTVAISFVVSMAFGKDFAHLDSQIGLPPGTTSTLVSAGIAIGVNAAFAAAGLIAQFAPLAALGGPVGIALMAAAVLASALGLLGRPKKRSATAGRRLKRVQRIYTSACGVYPGFEHEASLERTLLTGSDLTVESPNSTRLEIPSDHGAAPNPAIDATFRSTEAELAAAGTLAGTTNALGANQTVAREPTNPAAAAAPAGATDGTTLAAAQTAEATAQSFTSINELGFPACPTTFESGTEVQFRAHAPTVAQFKITTFIGNLLYLPDRLGENPTADPDGWFLRPRRIQSYGEQNRFLGGLLIPRYERQIDRLYGDQSDDGHYRHAVEPLVGIGANDFWLRAVAVTW
jgi:hypothetical protein